MMFRIRFVLLSVLVASVMRFLPNQDLVADGKTLERTQPPERENYGEDFDGNPVKMGLGNEEMKNMMKMYRQRHQRPITTRENENQKGKFSVCTGCAKGTCPPGMYCQTWSGGKPFFHQWTCQSKYPTGERCHKAHPQMCQSNQCDTNCAMSVEKRAIVCSCSGPKAKREAGTKRFTDTSRILHYKEHKPIIMYSKEDTPRTLYNKEDRSTILHGKHEDTTVGPWEYVEVSVDSYEEYDYEDCDDYDDDDDDNYDEPNVEHATEKTDDAVTEVSNMGTEHASCVPCTDDAACRFGMYCKVWDGNKDSPPKGTCLPKKVNGQRCRNDRPQVCQSNRCKSGKCQ